MDRLGSVRSGGTRYYPYGEEFGGTAVQEGQQFATYSRDGNTGLDYADQRYYNSMWGRFMTADPYMSGSDSGDTSNPISWNRYAYVLGDSTNYFDSRGLLAEQAEGGAGTITLDSTLLRLYIGTPFQTKIDPRSVVGDPLYATPEGRAKALAKMVKAKIFSDCIALSIFADAVARDFQIQQNDSIVAYFVQAFGEFVPSRDQSVMRANSSGIPIAGVAEPTILNPSDSGSASGFAPNYRESVDRVNVDQAHHFAAYFELGYFVGSTAAGIVAFFHDLNPYNAGDIALGIAAAQLGNQLRSGQLKPSDIGLTIRRNICTH